MNYHLYFSPTGGTKRATDILCAELGKSFDELDMTLPAERKKQRIFGANDLVVMGCPVYGGRLPQVDDLWENIQGQNTACVLCACFGNRDYDDMLLEWKNKMEAKGFVCIAAAAVVIPHVYSDKLGAGRPYAEDEKEIREFAQAILKKQDKTSVKVKGNFPYKEWKKTSVTPIKSDGCTDCGLCRKICPTEAINEQYIGNPEKCIQCMKCVRFCPHKARLMDTSSIQKYLESKYLARHSNEFFI